MGGTRRRPSGQRCWRDKTRPGGSRFSGL